MNVDEKVVVKSEPVQVDIVNPWLVDSVQAFTYLKCPECVFDTKEVHNFQAHALENHPLSIVLFGNGKVLKQERLDDSQNYADYCQTYLEDPNYNQSYEYIEYLDEKLEEKYQHEPKKEKKHICPVCNVGFTKSSHMKSHISSVHDGEKPFQCKLCETRFTRNGGLRRHMEVVHEKIKRHKCPHCEEAFNKRVKLKKHLASIHADKLQIEGPQMAIKSEAIDPDNQTDIKNPFEYPGLKQLAENSIEKEPKIKKIAVKSKCPTCDKMFANAHR